MACASEHSSPARSAAGPRPAGAVRACPDGPQNLPYRPVRDYRGGGPPQGGGGVMPRSALRHRCRRRDGNLPSGPPQADNLPQANPGHARPGTSLDRLLTQTIACFACGRQIAVPTTILRHVPRQAPGLPALYALAPTARPPAAADTSAPRDPPVGTSIACPLPLLIR